MQELAAQDPGARVSPEKRPAISSHKVCDVERLCILPDGAELCQSAFSDLALRFSSRDPESHFENGSKGLAQACLLRDAVLCRPVSSSDGICASYRGTFIAPVLALTRRDGTGYSGLSRSLALVRDLHVPP
jgi:hypothetical protein